jgi:site-specific DNA recombinase
MGKLYDDKGNLMSPSFSSKNGVRYRFYVSSALLRGRKAASGSVTRVSAQAIEQVTVQALRARYPDLEANDAALLERHLLRVQLGDSEIKLALLEPEPLQPSSQSARRRNRTSLDREIRIPWVRPAHSLAAPRHTGSNGSDEPNQKLVQAVVRAHRWANALVNAEFASLEQLAASVKLHPKVVRNEIRLAFLAPQISETILTAGCAFGLPDLRRISALSWQNQMEELHYRQPSDRLT